VTLRILISPMRMSPGIPKALKQANLRIFLRTTARPFSLTLEKIKILPLEYSKNIRLIINSSYSP